MCSTGSSAAFMLETDVQRQRYPQANSEIVGLTDRTPVDLKPSRADPL